MKIETLSFKTHTCCRSIITNGDETYTFCNNQKGVFRFEYQGKVRRIK